MDHIQEANRRLFSSKSTLFIFRGRRCEDGCIPYRKDQRLYERLSRDDEQAGESNSIQNQKKYLEEYARQKGLRNIRHFYDDGYSGTNFNRPGFAALLEEIEAGHVEVLIVKDLSRFGRNYLQVGYYTEILFPKKGVRFIAVNNNVDSATPQDNDFTPFLNIMNEWYAKDTSNKIKAVFKSRMKDGLRCSGSIPYGYKREPGDKQTLIVDEPAAEVVRKIFRLVCQGVTTTGITEILTKEKVLIPSAYAAMNQPKNCRHKEIADPYRWNATTIGYILDRQEYLGHTVLGKSICENFKTKQRRAATPDELMIFPDTHEAIIDQDTWDIARKIRSKKKPRVANGTYSHRLSGLVYCADCGARMGYISPETKHSGKRYDSDSAFQCGNYRSATNDCVSHYVKTSVLEAAILRAIQAVSKYVLENEAEFIDQLKAVWNEHQARAADNGQQELAEAKKRIADLDEKINKLYENSVNGLLPERQAQRMIQQYDEEQLVLEKRVAELESLAQQDEIKQVDASRFIAMVKKYRDCEDLTDTMLYAFRSLTGLRFTKPQADGLSTASRTLIFISISSATTTRLLKPSPRKNASQPSKPSSCGRSRKRASDQQSAESRSWTLCGRLRKPETPKRSQNMRNTLQSSVSETGNTVRSCRKPEKPAQNISVS